MTTLALPADTVQFYNDGPDFPNTPLLQEAERAYRDGFNVAANAAGSWRRPVYDLVESCRRSRRDARAKAEVRVPSSELFGRPDMDSEQIVYRAGHDVAASRARGKAHAFEFAVQCWEALAEEGVRDEVIGPLVLRPWAEQVSEWSRSEIDLQSISPPPSPEACIPDENRPLLEQVREDEPAFSTSLPVMSVRQLVNAYPELRRPVIHGLLREGETMNVIASSKVGKTFLVSDLALAVGTGSMWLGTFETERGDVLIIDNELHRETSSNRIRKVVRARQIPYDDMADRVFVVNLRGRLKDLFGLAAYFEELPPGRFKLIILDAFYRFLPRDTDENDNGTMSQLYNHLDCYAAELDCSFALVHHSSKGNQSGKSITDVGAGAGSQSRATDTHLVLRPHEENDVVVLDAAVRSWPPVEPRCLRWTFPVWTPDDTLDPADLLTARARRRRVRAQVRAQSDEPEWTAERFADEFITDEPELKTKITQKAKEQGLSARKASRLLREAEEAELAFRWKYASNQPVKYAGRSQDDGLPVRARTPP